MKAPPIDRAAVLRLADLAQLRLVEPEMDALVRDLERIVAHAGELADVDIDGVPPMERPAADGPPLPRRDVPIEGLQREELLAEAPRADESGFVVPAFVDEA